MGTSPENQSERVSGSQSQCSVRAQLWVPRSLSGGGAPGPPHSGPQAAGAAIVPTCCGALAEGLAPAPLQGPLTSHWPEVPQAPPRPREPGSDSHLDVTH